MSYQELNIGAKIVSMGMDMSRIVSRYEKKMRRLHEDPLDRPRTDLVLSLPATPMSAFGELPNNFKSGGPHDY